MTKAKEPRIAPRRVSGLRVGPKPVPVEKPRRRYVALVTWLEERRSGRFTALEFHELGQLLEAYGAEQFSAGFHLGSKER